MSVTGGRTAALDSVKTCLSLQNRHRESTSPPEEPPSEPPCCDIWAGIYLDHGALLEERFRGPGRLEDLENAISDYQKATELTKASRNVCRSTVLRKLEAALEVRLEKAAELGSNDRLGPIHYYKLRDALLGCLKSFIRPEDLESEISSLPKSVEISLDDHPDKAIFLGHLKHAPAVCARYLASPRHLDGSISTPQNAADLMPDDHVDKVMALSRLAHALKTRFHLLDNPEDLASSASTLRNAVEFPPDNHPDKITLLKNLENILRARFQLLSTLEDLYNAISDMWIAVGLTPESDPDKPLRTTFLEKVSTCHPQSVSNLARLEGAIPVMQSEPTPDGHLDKPNHLSNTGATFLERYECGGIHADLHTGEPAILSNRGKALRASYECTCKLDDSNTATSSARKVAGLIPSDYPDNQKRLITLVVELQERFERVGSSGDLDGLVSSLQKAVVFMEVGDPIRPICFNTLGKALKTRYERIGSHEDLDSSISSLEQAVALTQDSDPYKVYRLDNLGSAYSLSFSRRDRHPDLEKALSIQEKAVKLTPSGHPNESKILMNFGDALYTSSNSLGNRQHHKLAVDAYARAAKSAVGQPRKCFEAALKWAQCCRDSSESPIAAYSCAISLLPRIAPLGLGVTDQHALVSKMGGVVRDAVAAAIEDEKHVMALEWAEQGRSIVWQNLLNLRAPLDDLRLIYPELADRLQEVSQQMETPFGDAVLGSEQVAQPSEEVAHTHLELAVERDKLLKEIRSRPKFESFLRPETFDKLKAAARDGTVVILNVQDSRCDALALISDEHGVSVKGIPLKRFSYHAGQTLLQDLRSVLSSPEVRVTSIRGYRLPKYEANSRTGLDDILRILWLDVVKPVMQGLKYEVELANPPHIWWCPTGPLAFLPIHAAGLYDADGVGEKISDYVISSYTPTLAAILRQERSFRGPFHLLTVALPWTPNAPPLPYTKEEVGRIQRIATGLSLVELRSKSATMKRVADEMKISDWVHFACHGAQGVDNPLTSGLLLHDKKLELSEMIKMSLPKADFAFLSACQTATGDEMVAEESVHLASGMLFAGYRGLIATMWSINDKDAPQVAEDVYQQILKDGKPNRKEAARALHQAVKRLREESKGDLRSWVPFIHIGR